MAHHAEEHDGEVDDQAMEATPDTLRPVAPDDEPAAERAQRPLPRAADPGGRATEVHATSARRFSETPTGLQQTQAEVKVFEVGEKLFVEAADLLVGSPAVRNCRAARRRQRSDCKSVRVLAGATLVGAEADIELDTELVDDASARAGSERRDGADLRVSPQRLHNELKEVRLNVDVIIDQHHERRRPGGHSAVVARPETQIFAQLDNLHPGILGAKEVRSSIGRRIICDDHPMWHRLAAQVFEAGSEQRTALPGHDHDVDVRMHVAIVTDVRARFGAARYL